MSAAHNLGGFTKCLRGPFIPLQMLPLSCEHLLPLCPARLRRKAAGKAKCAGMTGVTSGRSLLDLSLCLIVYYA